MDEKELLKLPPATLVDMGVCPTCLNRKYGGAICGDTTQTLFYEDGDIECFFVKNPRADGHICISSIKHFHDMSEAPDFLNEKIVRFSKALMNIIKSVYGCERVYLCTMCDGPNNHYHVQLIPRYKDEKRGSGNFVKPRKEYRFDEEKFNAVKNALQNYVKL